ncbi:MAG TPA: PsiF family protein [Ramlibacter sp.]|nr:PsiF family protein [Ramlibacter sp.]
MKLATLVVLALGCSLVHANDRAQPPQPNPNRMSACQKEATASGKKGEERKAVLRACMAAGKSAKTG